MKWRMVARKASVKLAHTGGECVGRKQRLGAMSLGVGEIES
jgi:hypothetical protein